MAFYTTYKSNVNSKRLLVLVGVNHHFQTTIFVMALLFDETIESYQWALETFLECMGGQGLHIVITDGDLSMCRAIKDLMPDIVHRLCNLNIH